MDYKHPVQGIVPSIGAPADRKVAVVGTGSAGLGCADILVQKGYEVSVFESTTASGGLLVYEIQNFKHAKDIWLEKLEEFERAGVKFFSNTHVVKERTIDDLFAEGFDAVFIDIGSELDAKMANIPGTDLYGVYEATDFLIRTNVEPNQLPEKMRAPLEIGRRVVVISGGDSASDCLRSALRLGSEDVTCLYQWAENEMPAGEKIRKTLREEGVKYRFLTQPVKFIAGADGRLAAVECVEMKLGEPDANGHRKPVPVEGSNFSVAANTAILAIRYCVDAIIGLGQTPLKEGATLRDGLFTGGDFSADLDPIITAIEGGRKAALAIDEYLRNKK